MKEQLHTIPISDAMANAGECPFCYIEQKNRRTHDGFRPRTWCLLHGSRYPRHDRPGRILPRTFQKKCLIMEIRSAMPGF